MTTVGGLAGSAAARAMTAASQSAQVSAQAIGGRGSQDTLNIQATNRLNRETAVAQAGARNGEVAKARTEVALKGLNQAGEILGKMEQLALRASSGDLNASDRQALNAQAQQMSSELGEMMQNTMFNGKALFDGSISATRIDGEVTLNNADGLSIIDPLDGLDLSTQSGAAAALDQIADAQLATTVEQGKVATEGARLDRAVNMAQAKADTIAGSADSSGATDLAKEVSKFVTAKLQHQVGVKVAAELHKMETDAVEILLTDN